MWYNQWIRPVNWWSKCVCVCVCVCVFAHVHLCMHRFVCVCDCQFLNELFYGDTIVPLPISVRREVPKWPQSLTRRTTWKSSIDIWSRHSLFSLVMTAVYAVMSFVTLYSQILITNTITITTDFKKRKKKKRKKKNLVFHNVENIQQRQWLCLGNDGS